VQNLVKRFQMMKQRLSMQQAPPKAEFASFHLPPVRSGQRIEQDVGSQAYAHAFGLLASADEAPAEDEAAAMSSQTVEDSSPFLILHRLFTRASYIEVSAPSDPIGVTVRQSLDVAQKTVAVHVRALNRTTIPFTELSVALWAIGELQMEEESRRNIRRVAVLKCAPYLTPAILLLTPPGALRRRVGRVSFASLPSKAVPSSCAFPTSRTLPGRAKKRPSCAAGLSRLYRASEAS
jgi:hypothetical protein